MSIEVFVVCSVCDDDLTVDQDPVFTFEVDPCAFCAAQAEGVAKEHEEEMKQLRLAIMFTLDLFKGHDDQDWTKQSVIRMAWAKSKERLVAALHSEKPEPVEGEMKESNADRLVTVCASCERASCWHGDFMCDEAKTADTKEMTVGELKALALEDPSYWEAGPAAAEGS